MQPLQLPDPLLELAGERLACRLWLAYAGGYQLTLSSLLPALALELHSSYLGHPDGDTAVAHLLLTKQAGPQTDCRLRPGGELPVREARRRCLYDHLAQLQAALADQRGGPARIELHDRTLELVDHAERAQRPAAGARPALESREEAPGPACGRTLARAAAGEPLRARLSSAGGPAQR